MIDGNKINPLRWLSGPWDYRRLTAPRAIVIAGAAVALLMVSICATVLYQSRLDAMAHASATSRSLALLAERDIERNFDLYGLLDDQVVGVGLDYPFELGVLVAGENHEPSWL